MRNTYELGKEFKDKTGMDVFNPPVAKVFQERSTAYIDWVESELLQAREELSQAKQTIEKVNKASTIFGGSEYHNSPEYVVKCLKEQVRSFQESCQKAIVSKKKFYKGLLEARKQINASAIYHDGQASMMQSLKRELSQAKQNIEKLKECLSEAVDLVKATVEGEYIPDSFSTQPWEIALIGVSNTGKGEV